MKTTHLLWLLSLSYALVGASADDSNRSLRGDTYEKELTARNDDTPDFNDEDNIDEIFFDGTYRRLTGRVVIGLQKPEALRELGKTDTEIDQLRSEGYDEIAKNDNIVIDGSSELDYSIVELGMGLELVSYIKSLLNGPKSELFRFVEPEYLEYPVGSTPNDSRFASAWHHVTMETEMAWDITKGSSSVTVGICDTGIDTEHEDLTPTRLPGFVSVGSIRYEGSECPPHAPNCFLGGDVRYVHPHGTQCAGMRLHCISSLCSNDLSKVYVFLTLTYVYFFLFSYRLCCRQRGKVPTECLMQFLFQSFISFLPLTFYYVE